MSARATIASVIAAVLAFGLSSCGGARGVSPSINYRATLNGSLPWNPLQWNVITSSADRRAATMSVLYGNDAAVRYARSNSQQAYPAGSILALVTWTQQNDVHWFGARIPGAAKSVEFVSVNVEGNDRVAYYYRTFEGSPLQQTSAWNGSSPEGRAAYLLSLRASVLP